MTTKAYALGTAIAVDGDGSDNEMNNSPFVEDDQVMLKIRMTGLTASTAAKIQGKDNDADSYTDLLTTGAVTTQTRELTKQSKLYRYMRYTMTGRSAGTVDFEIVNG